jgi:ribosome biogenesis protein ERB1
MGPTTADKKRKAVTRDVPEVLDSESEAEFGDGLLEGILSQSEDEEDESEEEDEEEDDEDELR